MENDEKFNLELRSPVICVVGPTASGKSDFAQEVAIKRNGEVVSADSMQIYRGMDIGTGKLPSKDRKVPHHGLDLCSPDTPYSAALYQDYARQCFVDIDMRGKRSIVCGGTGLYIRAAIDDYSFPQGDQVNNPVRDFYTLYAKNQGNLALWELLSERDPKSAQILHPNNVRRVVRAFELLDEGTSYAEQNAHLHEIRQAVPAFFIGLQVDSKILNARIDARVDSMVQEGLVDEVRTLLDHGFRTSITAPQAIGYKEIVDALDGFISVDEAIANIKSATRRYAKRQRTWFRSDQRIHWFNADSGDIGDTLSQALELLDTLEI